MLHYHETRTVSMAVRLSQTQAGVERLDTHSTCTKKGRDLCCTPNNTTHTDTHRHTQTHTQQHTLHTTHNAQLQQQHTTPTTPYHTNINTPTNNGKMKKMKRTEKDPSLLSAIAGLRYLSGVGNDPSFGTESFNSWFNVIAINVISFDRPTIVPGFIVIRYCVNG